MLEHFPALILAAQQTGEVDLDEQSMSMWARLVVSVAQILLGAVLGAGATKGYMDHRARFMASSLSPQERAMVARQLALRGEPEEAAMLSAASPVMFSAQTALLGSLSPEERAAVAARLAQSGPAPPGSSTGWTTEPPASAVLSSREASMRLRAKGQARMDTMQQPAPEAAAGPVVAALSSDTPAAEAAFSAAASVVSAANIADNKGLLELWQQATASFAAWVRSPAEEWLPRLDSAEGPAAVLRSIESALAERDSLASNSFAAPSRFLEALRDELALATLVLTHTRSALAPETGSRSRSIQIANAAQYALHEMPDAGETLRKLNFEEALQGLG